MKKLIILASFSVFLFTSCNREYLLADEEKTNRLVLCASQETARTHLGPETGGIVPVLFDASDELWVYSRAEGKSAKFTTSASDISADGKKAAFSGNLGDTGPYVAIYPYQYAAETSAADRIVLNIPSVQRYRENSFGLNSSFTAACWRDGKIFTLKSMSGCLCVSLKGKGTIAKMVLEDNDSSFPLWGECTAVPDFGTGDITDISFSNEAKDCNVLTMLIDNPVVLSSSQETKFYFPVPEGSLAKGFTISLYDPDGKLMKTISTSTNMSAKLSVIKRLETISIDNILFSGGEGTEAKPYRIATLNDLDEMATYINAGQENFAKAWYSQTKDIENAAMKDHIGSYGSTHPFSGVYNGNGFKITDLAFTAPTSEDGHGLFGFVLDGIVRNVNVQGYSTHSAIKSNKHEGVIVGVNKQSSIINCSCSGKVSLSCANISGGIAGINTKDAVIKDCSVSADITVSTTYTGGIVGNNNLRGQVDNCSFTGTITATGAACGGIVGYDDSDLDEAIKSCSFNGSIVCSRHLVGGILGKKNSRNSGIVDCISNGSVSGTTNVGGIVGGIAPAEVISLKITGCSNAASVTGSDVNVGGIMGYANDAKAGSSIKIDRCSNTGNVEGLYNVGGIIGMATTSAGDGITAINCVCCNCELCATGIPDNLFIRLGGIMGGSDNYSAANVDLLNCCSFGIKLKSTVSTATVKGVGGIAGSQYSVGNIESCYSAVATDDMIYTATASAGFGAIVGYYRPLSAVPASNRYDKANTYGASKWNGGTGITTVQFKDGTLLAAMNESAKSVTGAVTWVVDKASGYPVPSGTNVDPTPVPVKTVRVLAIGNSFSADAVEQNLWNLFDEAGYNAIVANAYIASCTLETHWNNEISSTASKKNSNSYRKVLGGVKTTYANKSLEYILKDEPWDYVIFQQGGGLYGITESHYPYLDNLLEYAAGYLKKGSYETGYQMTWAYPANSTSESFAKYGNDQMKMYNACMNTAFELQTRSKLDIVIPTGTAIQNGRKTPLGDTFNRDWGHLSFSIGRYTAACTWFEIITGIDVTTLTYRPTQTIEKTIAPVSAEDAAICRKCAHAAVLQPRKVTEVM